MRTAPWGVAVCALVVGAVVLPSPLWWWLLAVVVAAFICAGTAALGDYRRRKEAQARAAVAAETASHLADLAQIRDMGPSEWERIQEAIAEHQAPLVYPGQVRTTGWVPPQRTAVE